MADINYSMKSTAMEKAIDSTAKALASLSHGSKDPGPSKGFQTLIKLIGESKTKHVRNWSPADRRMLGMQPVRVSVVTQ